MKLFFTITTFIFILNGYSQLTTATSQTPTQLVENVLVGGGVDISNVTYTGDANAIGSFNGTNTNLGLGSGIILTTGTVLNVTDGGVFGSGQQGPFGPNDASGGGVDNAAAGYAPLTDIVNNDTYNAAILEFDFGPQSDSIKFRYVFGSEEYPENVGADFNDVFAFFISGPGFGGTVNMATIPGTTDLISVNSVNNGDNNTGPCQNCAYYIHNGDGNSGPQQTDNTVIQYDGFTTVITASAQVECGETYHLKIAIADVGDGIFDSGIFLEANSLDSQLPLEVQSSSTFNLPDNQIAEGCETGTITLNRDPSNSASALTVPINVTGTATEGVDYEDIPSSVTFTPGQSTLTITFDIFDDNIAEGNELIKVEFDYPDPCGNSNLTFEELTIIDVDPLVITIPDQDLHCNGDEATLTPEITGGINNYTYLWDGGQTTEAITAAPIETTTYSLTVTDLCITTPIVGTGTINVPVYGESIITLSDDVTVLCPNTPRTISGGAIGGEGTHTYNWILGNDTIATTPTLNVSPMETTTYTLEATDGCGTVTTSDLLFTVTTPVFTVNIIPNQLRCDGDTATIWVEGQGGLGGFTYYWYDSGDTDSSRLVQPQISTLYTVAVEDGCHTYTIDAETKITHVRPYASFNVISSDPEEGEEVVFQNNSDASVAWYWDFANGESSNRFEPTTSYYDWGWKDITLVAINEIGCTDTLYRTIYIKPPFHFYVPNAFTPDADALNKTFSVSTVGVKSLEFYIYNRWGDLIYQTTDMYFSWDGRYNGIMVPDGIYVYRTVATNMEGIPKEFTGTIAVLK
jgi:gliding motility-associated-like protein